MPIENAATAELIKALPKAELHLHIEGSLEPELMMALAAKHHVTLPYATIDDVRRAYNFDNLQSFLDLYYLGASVLRDEDDFYRLMWDYLCKCKEDKVVHAEIMFDPQTHTERGIGFEVFMSGFMRAIAQAEKEWGQSTLLIMSFLRHLSEESAFETLEAAQPYLSMITAVGLDSSELGNPPQKFARVFAKAKSLGLLRVAHAGEEGPAEYIWSALNDLDVHRIDHGVRSVDDPALMQTLAQKQMPLTVCPLSNIKLCVFSHMREHNILSLLDSGLLVTVNADDPSYFGGYLNDNYHALAAHLPITQEQIKTLAANSFKASFLAQDKKALWLAQVAAL
ncbi:MAG: adenosine deaminase [Paraglaciecola chathamensis]|uniref:adenosine deaminase n=1 Tax=Paraglaciecola chathamensis TaxID=368405 RepID=UPI0026FD87DD|nr:adenosine deaminase [Paraglaciecola chathamensis]MDO6560118.1 adenosine deaminase [Paraglaciecola chathamensis]